MALQPHVVAGAQLPPDRALDQQSAAVVLGLFIQEAPRPARGETHGRTRIA